jgi:hypothetical protein
VSAVASIVKKVQDGLAAELKRASRHGRRLTKFRKAAWRRIQQLHGTMQTLLPQIRYWLRTGFVAKNKIVSLYIPQIYAILRGKVGKPIEFGLNWGIERLRGGFLLATLAKDKLELMDSRFAVRAAKDHQALFGKAPRSYAYDRAGSSEENFAALKKLGVSNVGLAPRGKAKWRVRGKVKERLISERAQVEGGIGAIKSGKYGFNRPAAKSAAAMGVCGQRAVLGFNLNKLMNGLAERRRVVLVG